MAETTPDEPIEVHDSQAAEALAQEAGGIKTELAQLTGIVTTLAGAMTAQLTTTTRRSRINWYSTIALIISFMFDIVLTGYLVNVENKLARQQNITSSVVLCPVWNLILTGYNPQLRPAGPLRDQYIASFKAIINGRNALNCKGAVAPGPVPGPTPSPTRTR